VRTAQEIIDRFEAGLRAHPDLGAIVRIVAPYKALMGDPSGVVATLDALVYEYGQARGLKIEVEENAA
jgi:hypothetical protein